MKQHEVYASREGPLDNALRMTLRTESRDGPAVTDLVLPDEDPVEWQHDSDLRMSLRKKMRDGPLHDQMTGMECPCIRYQWRVVIPTEFHPCPGLTVFRIRTAAVEACPYRAGMMQPCTDDNGSLSTDGNAKMLRDEQILGKTRLRSRKTILAKPAIRTGDGRGTSGGNQKSNRTGEQLITAIIRNPKSEI
jgi:hypothetical protein